MSSRFPDLIIKTDDITSVIRIVESNHHTIRKVTKYDLIVMYNYNDLGDKDSWERILYAPNYYHEYWGLPDPYFYNNFNIFWNWRTFHREFRTTMIQDISIAIDCIYDYHAKRKNQKEEEIINRKKAENIFDEIVKEFSL